MESTVGQSKLIDLPQIVSQVSEKWHNQTLCQVNDCLIRLGIFEGEFHWHKHDREDEFFFTVEGCLLLDIRDEDGTERTFELRPKQGYTVPRGVMHRTRATTKTVVLMIEQNTVKPKGD